MGDYAQGLPIGLTRTFLELCAVSVETLPAQSSSVCPLLSQCQTSVMVSLHTPVPSHRSFTVFSPNQYLICLIPSWHLLLEKPKLTKVY